MKLPIRRRVWFLIAGVLLSFPAIPVSADEEVGGPAQVAGAAPANDPLGDLVDEAIRVSARRRLVAHRHTPWQIVHGALAYRHDFLIRDGDRDVPAIEWMAGGVSYNGEPWFEKTPYGGRAHTFTKPYIFEGHPNQFLALLSLSKLPRDFEFQTKDGAITIDDMIEHAKMTANTREEMTWTLWAFSHYVPHDARWRNKDGEPWSVERLIQKEIGNDVNRGACGGTHGLYALAAARDAYLRETGQPLRGAWLAADQKVQQHVQITRMLQNPDGTFSTNYFAGRGNARDFDTVLVSNGHILEFLMRALPEERVNEEWVRRGVTALARGLIDYRNAPLDCGPLYHAVSGLTLYRERTRPAAPPLLADAVENEATPKRDPGASPRRVERPMAPMIAAKPRENSAAEPRRVVPKPLAREADPQSVASQPVVEESADETPEQRRGLLSRIPLPFTPAAPSASSTGPRPSSDVPQPIPLPAPSVATPRSTPPTPEPPTAVASPSSPGSVPPSIPPVDVAEIEREREKAAREEARRRQAEEARLAEVRKQQEEETRRAEERRKQVEETRQAELRRLQLAADAKRIEADALAAEAAAQRAAVEAKSAETKARQAEAAVKRAEAEAKQAEAEALRLEAAAKQAEVEALRAEADALRQAVNPKETSEKE